MCSKFLERLSQQLIQIGEKHHKVPFVKLSTQDRRNCYDHGKSSSAPASSSIVKVEVDVNDVDHRWTGSQENEEVYLDQKPSTKNECPASNSTHYKVQSKEQIVCALCLQSTLGSYQWNTSTCVTENEILQQVFQTTYEGNSALTDPLVFCQRCFKWMESLRTCYLQYREALKRYQEDVLRLRCFRKCSQNFDLNTDHLKSSFNAADEECDDHFDEGFDFDSTNSKLIHEPLPRVIIKVPKKNRKTNKHEAQTRISFIKGKPKRRHGGLTEEEYRERRRVQSAEYYRKRRLKMGKELRHSSILAEGEGNNSKVDTPSTLEVNLALPISSQTLDSESINNDEHFEDNKAEPDFLENSNDETPSSVVGPLKKKKSSATRKGDTNRKKYYDKRRTIRRHGGISEEQYLARRRAQSRQYYTERKRRAGTLTFGPKPLSIIKRKELEKAEKLCLDSSQLPAKSSCGPPIRVIQLETGKRFSYRNVEITKDDDGTLHCGNCGHTAKCLNVLKKHIKKTHFDREHGYKCSYPNCNRTYYYRYQLVAHEGSHTEKGAGVQCETCGQSFKHRSCYFNHRRIIHQGIKPHECQLCQKRFGTRKDLRKHTESKSHQAKLLENGKADTEMLPKPDTIDWNSEFSLLK